MFLTELNIGQKARIVDICDNSSAAMLMEFGILPGKKLMLLRKAPLGDPILIDLEGFLISLRIEEAKNIIIEKV